VEFRKEIILTDTDLEVIYMKVGGKVLWIVLLPSEKTAKGIRAKGVKTVWGSTILVNFP
jgi:hypothetical protein